MNIFYGRRSFFPVLYIIIVIVTFNASCVNTRKAVYFDDIKDSTIYAAAGNLEPIIQKNDLLSITVSSLNPEANRIFNTPSVNNVTEAQGAIYLVNQEGNIEFPFLGTLKAAGMIKRQLKETITKSLSDRKLLVNPIVDVRYLNYKISVLGEVAHPTVITVPSEKITLLEALGLAGDLTIYARRDNVMVIRDDEGSKTIKRLNLNSAELFTSPYYYLRSNDIVYVEPNKARIASTSRSNQLLPAIFGALSFVTIVIDRLTR